MNKDNDLSSCRYDLVFIHTEQRTSERRTQIVIVLTGAIMILEIVAGILLGSMALLADGWHMASHAAALGSAALGMEYKARLARLRELCHVTVEVNPLSAEP